MADRLGGPFLVLPSGRLANVVSLCFFFQAEDGIRDLTVTGVQTCALPIFDSEYSILQGRAPRRHAGGGVSEARVRPEDPAAFVVASSPEGHAREHRSPDELAGSPRGPDLPAGEPADSSYPPRLHPPRQSAGFRQARP